MGFVGIAQIAKARRPGRVEGLDPACGQCDLVFGEIASPDSLAFWRAQRRHHVIAQLPVEFAPEALFRHLHRIGRRMRIVREPDEIGDAGFGLHLFEPEGCVVIAGLLRCEVDRCRVHRL